MTINNIIVTPIHTAQFPQTLQESISQYLRCEIAFFKNIVNDIITNKIRTLFISFFVIFVNLNC